MEEPPKDSSHSANPVRKRVEYVCVKHTLEEKKKKRGD